MDPYATLGVVSTTPIEEIETSYRLLLRKYHPDLHQAGGTDAVQEAERITRDLNEAMGKIRTQFRRNGGPTVGPPPGPGSTRADHFDPNDLFRDMGAAGRHYQQPSAGGPGAAPPYESDETAGWRGPQTGGTGERDWFGNPVSPRADDPVPCPYCNRPFTDIDDFQAHLDRDHQFRKASYRVPKPPRVNVFAAIVNALGWFRFIPWWVAIGATIAFAGLTRFNLWVVFPCMVITALVLWGQTSPRFKARSKYG